MCKEKRNRIVILVTHIIIIVILLTLGAGKNSTKIQINYSKYRTEYKEIVTISEELEERYTLKDIIPENLVIKNQESSPSCWTFAVLASLETNLALQDIKNNVSTKLYDFSEMHVEYSTIREFLNNETNEKGYNIGPFQLGMFRRAVSYLTNGFGAVDESSMPFEQYCKDCVDTEDYKIDLSDILNKEVTAQVNDTIEFPAYDVIDSNIENIEN